VFNVGHLEQGSMASGPTKSNEKYRLSLSTRSAGSGVEQAPNIAGPGAETCVAAPWLSKAEP